ncbi:D-alanyl-D-alanine carboxypeptidase family protein [Oerskovia sp. M15]
MACGVAAYELLGSPESSASSALSGPEGAARAGASASQEPVPASGLDPELVRRFERAQALAAEDGIELTLVSGWRSAEEQAQVVEDVVRKRGSQEEAKRWVLPRSPRRTWRARRSTWGDRRCAVARPARRGAGAVPDLRERDVALRGGHRTGWHVPRDARGLARGWE